MRRHYPRMPQGHNLQHEVEPWHDFVLTTTPSFPNALCADHDNPDLWFANDVYNQRERLEASTEAAAICGVCPHRIECLTYALEQRIWSGIWGGATEMERKAMLR